MKVFTQYGRSSILALMISIFVVIVPHFASAQNGEYNMPPPPTAEQAARNKIYMDGVNAGQAERAAAAPPAGDATNSDAPAPKVRGMNVPNANQNCVDKANTANSLCNTMSMMGVDDPAQGAMMENMVNQAMGMASQIQSSGANGAQQCSNQAKLSELMAGINALKAGACMFGQNRCESACEKANTDADEQMRKLPATEKAKIDLFKKEITANNRVIDKCKQFTINTMMAAMQAMKFGGSMLQDKACAAALSQTPVNPTIAGVTLPTGGTDCSDPAMASSNVSCICAANPAASICGNAAAGSQIGGSVGGLGSTGPGGAPRPLGSSAATDGVAPTGLGSPAPQTGVAGGPTGGGGGGGIGGGGGAPGGPSGDDQGGGAPADKSSVIGGVSAGGGGGVGSPGNPYGSNGSGKGDGSKGFFDKFNLSKFLPSKKDFGSRGLGGMSLQSKDGITGPMGPSLWEKVTNQYQVQKPKMIQDR